MMMVEIPDYKRLAETITAEEMDKLPLPSQRNLLPHLINAFQASVRHCQIMQEAALDRNRHLHRLGGDDIEEPTAPPTPDESRLHLYRTFYEKLHCNNGLTRDSLRANAHGYGFHFSL